MDFVDAVKLVFIGSSIFGLKCLRACVDIPQIEIAGIITAPKKFGISYRPEGVTNILHADISEFAKVKNIPVVTLELSMADSLLFQTITEWKPDAFLVVGWYHMIPKSWRKLAPAYGLHASLLPDYSGGAPLVWAMINGETKTGITLFKMDDGVDSGPIADQREVSILPDDTIASLYARIETKGIELLRYAIPAMAAGTLHLREQDPFKRRVMPQRAPEDGRIDWNQDAEAVIRFIRAQTKPYPGAFTLLKGELLFIWAATVFNSTKSYPVGQVRRLADDTFIVCCEDGAVALKEVSYKSETYRNSELAQLFGSGKQQLCG